MGGTWGVPSLWSWELPKMAPFCLETEKWDLQKSCSYPRIWGNYDPIESDPSDFKKWGGCMSIARHYRGRSLLTAAKNFMRS